MRAGVLRAVGTLGVVRGLGLVRVWRLIIEAMIRELVLAIIVSAHDVKPTNSS